MRKRWETTQFQKVVEDFPLEYNDSSILKACITKVKEGNTVDRRSTENEAQSNINEPREVSKKGHGMSFTMCYKNRFSS